MGDPQQERVDENEVEHLMWRRLEDTSSRNPPCEVSAFVPTSKTSNNIKLTFKFCHLRRFSSSLELIKSESKGKDTFRHDFETNPQLEEP